MGLLMACILDDSFCLWGPCLTATITDLLTTREVPKFEKNSITFKKDIS
jgi:hypothetical protein